MNDTSCLDTRPDPIVKLVNGLAHATQRTKIINLRLFCDVYNPDCEHWENVDPDSFEPTEIVETISVNHVVTCLDVLSLLPDQAAYLAFLSAAYQRGGLVITTLVTNEPQDLLIYESVIPQYREFLMAAELQPLFLGLRSDVQDGDKPGLVSIHEPRLQQQLVSEVQRPLAILSCYNEADVLGEVIEHWVAEGCSVHVMDNWSADGSWPLLLAASDRFGELVTIERFPLNEPASGSWQDILKRKEEIAAEHLGRWIIHTDADEIRRSPIMPFNLADSLALVEAAGWNRVDFTVLNHRPIDDRPLEPGGLVEGLPYFEFGTKPGHFVQKKAWIQGSNRAVLASSGGHIADFEGARDCPYRFLLHHYPLRSPEHARRKINQERVGRWLSEEIQRGWHSHYNDFVGSERIIWQPDHLHDSRDFFWERHGLQILLGLHDLGENGT